MEQNTSKLPLCPTCVHGSLKGKTIAGTNKRGHEALVSTKHHEASASAAAATAAAVVTAVAAGDESAANSVLPAEICGCGRPIKAYPAAADVSPAPLVDAGVAEEDQEENKTKKARVMFSIDLNKPPPSDDDDEN